MDDRIYEESISKLLFCNFICLTDVLKDIRAQEVAGFNKLMEDLSWVSNHDLRIGLECLRKEYAAIWIRYESGSLPIDLAIFHAELDRFIALLEIARIKPFLLALKDFSRRIASFGYSTLSKLTAKEDLVVVMQKKIEAIIDDKTEHDYSLKNNSIHHVVPSQTPSQTSLQAPLNQNNHQNALIPHQNSLDENQAILVEEKWSGGRTLVRCIDVIEETHDVKSYVFEALPARLFSYKPGQFITLELPIEGRVLRRSYTISSSPSRPYALSITVKRVPKGWISNWLYENMVEGYEFYINGPSGDFSIFNYPSDKYLFISGGSGITPVMSMLRWLCDTHAKADIVFINHVRTPKDIIFQKELEYLATRKSEHLKIAIVPKIVPSGYAWNGFSGGLSELFIRLFAQDFLEREIFVCGPAGYMSMVKNLLESMSFPMHKFHQEAFGGAPINSEKKEITNKGVDVNRSKEINIVKPVMALKENNLNATSSIQSDKNPSEMVELVFSKSNITVSCQKDEYILDVAERAGVNMNYSCRAGSCGTCKVKKIKGQVEMDDQQALTEADVNDDYVLACVGKVKSLIIVDA